MSKTIPLLFVVIITILTGVFFVNQKSDEIEGGVIKIGFIGPLTGDVAALGNDARVAAQLAVDELNAQGGIYGKKVELVVEDGGCDGKTASNAAQKLIAVDGVFAIIGGLCSPETLSFAEYTNKQHIPVISYCSSAPSITDAGEYIFRIFPSDTYQGVFTARYIKETMRKNRVAVLYSNDEWGSAIQNIFVDEFKKLGGNIVGVESFAKDTRDMRTQLAKIKALNPEALYFLGFTEASVVGMKQIRELGITVPVVGGETWTDQAIIDAGTRVGGEFVFSEAVVSENDVFADHMKAVGAQATVCAPRAYDAVMIMADAFKKTGKNSIDLVSTLLSIHYTNGVSTSEIKFDEHGDLKDASYRMMLIRDGKKEEIR